MIGTSHDASAQVVTNVDIYRDVRCTSVHTDKIIEFKNNLLFGKRQTCYVVIQIIYIAKFYFAKIRIKKLPQGIVHAPNTEHYLETQENQIELEHCTY